jgi:glutamate:Na+ symporter, ESS family
VGLGAPLSVLRSGGRALVVLILATTVLAALQNVVGASVAVMLHQPPLLGVVCGALSLVGGVGTVGGLAPDFEAAGFAAAVPVGIAAATFGLIAAGLLAGPLAEWLLRLRGVAAPATPAGDPRVEAAKVADFFGDVRALAADGGATLLHLLVVAACLKIGAWLNLPLKWTGLSLPVYMGALLTGFALRMVHDLARGTWLRDEIIRGLAVVLLALFLAVTLAPLNLAQLAQVAGPMLAILIVNTLVSLAFAALIVWRLLGRDYEAAVMTAGFVGFGVGSTGTAVAAMDAIARRRGPAPRAFAIVPPTGGFIIDYPNAAVIAAFIKLLK